MTFPYTHPHPNSEGETCRMCQRPASHKVAEETPDAARHELTAYLCCNHFARLMGPFASRLCLAASQA